MNRSARRRRAVAVAGMILAIAGPARAQDDWYQVVDGLAVYFGVLSAAMVQGHPDSHTEATMHGGVPAGRHVYHVMVAVFDAASGERVEDAEVTARIAGLGLVGETLALEPMRIAETVTYGNFVDLPGADLYRIRVTIRRAEQSVPVTVEFRYDHQIQ